MPVNKANHRMLFWFGCVINQQRILLIGCLCFLAYYHKPFVYHSIDLLESNLKQSVLP